MRLSCALATINLGVAVTYFPGGRAGGRRLPSSCFLLAARLPPSLPPSFLQSMALPSASIDSVYVIHKERRDERGIA